MEIEQHADWGLIARHVEDAGDLAELGWPTLDVERADNRGHDPLADVVEHQLE
jgi:hypothetical protein